MKVVIGVDWSDEAFAAVEQVAQLYRPKDITLVHGVDLGVLRSPIVAEAANLQGYDEFRNALIDAGRQVLDRTAGMLPGGSDRIAKINEIGNPAKVILDAAESTAADLIAVGARGHGRLTELVLGSVSHRVLLHATRPTLIVKGTAKPIQRVLVAVEGRDDAERIKQWLTVQPFANPVELCILSVVASLRLADPHSTIGFEAWSERANSYAEDLVKTLGTELLGSRYTVSTRVVTGDAASVIAKQAEEADLVVVSSHGRRGLDRFLLGSVSHAIVHRVKCPILVVR